ncbi:MAG: glycosyltransferase family 4 protein [Candidatus Heimdallarchaeota archaeon]
MVPNIKVAVFIEQWFPQIGGSEIREYQLAKLLAERGIEFTFFVRNLKDSKGRNAPGKEWIHPKICIERLGTLPTSFESNIFRIEYLIRSIAKLQRLRSEFDLLHAHTFTGGLSALCLSKMGCLPSILTIQAIHKGRWADVVPGALQSRIISHIDAKILSNLSAFDNIAVVSRKHYQFLINNGLSPSKIMWVPNGINEAEINRKNTYGAPEKPMILFAGRMTKVKGIEYLLKAFSLIRKKIDAELLIAGDGPDRERLVRMASSLGIAGHTKFLGNLNQRVLFSKCREASVFVLPSTSEGFPISIIEAWACSCPVVATTVGDLSRLVVPGENGYLVPPKNPQELARSISKALDSPDHAHEMGRKGQDLVRRDFTWEPISGKIFRLYQQIAHKNQ